MKARVFQAISDLVYRESGIQLKEGKETMVAARISHRLKALSLDSEEAYLDYLQRESASEIVQLLDVISTNVTHFFRESEHFTFVDQHITQRIEEGQTRIRLWSAASSTGEEPYTLAMTAAESVERSRAKVDLRILATDISTRVLDIAKRGTYPEAKTRNIPKPLLTRYMRRRTENGEAVYQVSDELRELILYRRLNLSAPPFPMRGPLDLVMCRNVMIYFDDRVRDGIVSECRRLLRPGGLLIVGKSESLRAGTPGFERIGPCVFRKQED